MLFVLSSEEEISIPEGAEVVQIATFESDWLYYVDAGLGEFESSNPDARPYYEAVWEQTAFPNAPGETPLEKFLNGRSGIGMSNPPRWNHLLGAIALSPEIYMKLLTTNQSNAFSALQTLILVRGDIELFKSLLAVVIAGIPDGLTQEQYNTLDGILIAHNFPSLSEIIP